MSRRIVLAVGALGVGVATLEAQVPVRGRVLAAENDQPLAGASVYALGARRGAETDRHGRFVLWLGTLPDTLVARFIGRMPDTVVLDSVPGEVTLVLTPSAVPLAGVLVEADPRRPADAPPATWSLPAEAVAAVPSAVEPDVFRGLALSPAVAYPTPFSSQPFVRGTDPGAVGYRLDGFTLINPFHLGRIFSALMPQAIQSVTLALAPFGEEFGDATSGIVDARMREGSDEVRGGGQASLVSLASWAGGPLGRHRWFLGGRHGFLEHLGGPFGEVPYRFNDLYARLALAPGGAAPVHLTAFWSGDRAFHRETGEGVGWYNALLGLRVPLQLGAGGQVELWGETSRFSEDVVGLDIRGATDIANRFSTSAAGARLQWVRPRGSVSLGGEVRHRRMRNRVTGGDRAAPGARSDGMVTALTAGLHHRAGPASARVGLRLDADGVVHAWQPRIRLGLDLGRGWALGVAAGRTARLYHVIAEVLPGVEDVASVYDLWRPAGRAGTPLPRSDHALVEIRAGRPGLAFRAGVFAGNLRGVGEIRPAAPDTAGSFFRFGRGRVWGADLELSATGARRSVGLAYVLSWSRRRWDRDAAPAIPWRHDRRHQARAFVTWFTGRGWRFNLLADLASAEPITPAFGTMELAGLHPGEGSLNRRAPASPTMVLGPENSARGGWTGHVDVGVRKEIGGPGRSVGHLGVSILNLSLAPVAPAVPGFSEEGPLRVVYRPRFFLPPVPTVTFDLEF
ncbi:MAG TPA: carboxypeptidase-like regulatory domain-containing protein [Gemmatimonadales bacterium]|nr:carboxypeptidase-like regulatory domain-containing protein [Gemmatimonadales bacterium]